MSTNPTFEQLPKIIADLNDKIDTLMTRLNVTEPEKDRFMNMEQLIEFLPEHPARSTVYGWVNYRMIPYQKHGRRLYFLQSDISEWIDNGRKWPNPDTFNHTRKYN